MKIIFILPLIVACISSRAQMAKGTNASDSIAHIEMYGETGKGDTVIIVYTNGKKRKVLLPDEKSRERFMKVYKDKFPTPELQVPQEKHKHGNGEHSKSAIMVPKEITEYTYSDENVHLNLRNGQKESYDLKDPVQRKDFIAKYKNFLQLE